MRNRLLAIAGCTAFGVSAWSLASSPGRVDADEQVSSMLPPPAHGALWEPSEKFQAFSFGGQAALGVAVFGLAWAGMRRRAR